MARTGFQGTDAAQAVRPFIPALLIIGVQLVVFPSGRGRWA